MKLEQSFEVGAPVERVWQALIDVERVAPCLPGAAITGKNDDGSYNGTFTVKIGPTTAAYTGKLQMDSVDEASRSATMSAQGSDKRGQGGASATIASRVEPAGDGRTRVVVDTDYHITGRLARFGRGGMIEDISERLLKEFAQRLAASLEGDGGDTEEQAVAPAEPAEPGEADEANEPASPSEAAGAAPPAEPAEGRPPPPPPPPAAASEPLDAGSMVGSMLAERVRANPWPLIAAVFVLWRLLRRRRR
jgi:uncharacterized protein